MDVGTESCGPFQIKFPYWEDCGRPGGGKYFPQNKYVNIVHSQIKIFNFFPIAVDSYLATQP